MGGGECWCSPDAAPHGSPSWAPDYRAPQARIIARGRGPDLERNEANLGWRQLAIIGADGKGAVFNGARITSILKAKVGTNCAAAGNILRTPGVVDAMVAGFKENEVSRWPNGSCVR